ncbi:hypothetical protein ACN2C7_10935 [Caulobacter sp. ErkDOM-E]|uniref:hypothetical protein n=1 Tax=Caulobacter sp. ErkDOM-E TaxID=3402778 RepID=UPI003AF83B4D
MTVVVGELVADLSANSAAFKDDIQTARKSLADGARGIARELLGIDNRFHKTREGIEATGKAGAGWGKVAQAAGVGVGFLVSGLILAEKKALDTAAALDGAATKAGITTKELLGLRYAASQTDGLDKLDAALAKYSENVGQAHAGTGSFLKYLRDTDPALATAVRATKTQSEAIAVLANAVRDTEDPYKRTALATAAFGDAGKDLVDMLSAGDAGLRTFSQRAEDLGITLDEKLIANAVDAKKRLEDLQQVIGMQLTSALIKAAPQISGFAEDLALAIPDLIEFGNRLMDVMNLGTGGIDGKRKELKKLRHDMEVFDGIFKPKADPINNFLTRIGANGSKDQRARWQGQWQTGHDANQARITRLEGEISTLERIKAERAARLAKPVAGGKPAGEVTNDPLEDKPKPKPRGGGGGRGRERVDEAQTVAERLYESTRSPLELYLANLKAVADFEGSTYAAKFGGFETASRARADALLDLAQKAESATMALDELNQLEADGAIAAVDAAAVRAKLADQAAAEAARATSIYAGMTEAQRAAYDSAERMWSQVAGSWSDYRHALEDLSEFEKNQFAGTFGGFETASQGRIDALVRLTEATEDYIGALVELNRLLDAGLISSDDYKEAEGRIKGVGQETDKAKEKTTTLRDDLRAASKDLSRDVAANFAQVVSGSRSAGNALRDSWSSVIESISAKILERFVTKPMENALDGLFDKILGSAGGASGGGGGSSGGWSGLMSIAKGASSWFSSMFKAAPGAANGTDFVVPGVGGTDTKMLGLRVSPGERVRVSKTPGGGSDDGSGGARPSVNVTFNLSGAGGLAGFQQSRGQVETAVARAVQRGMRNT